MKKSAAINFVTTVSAEMRPVVEALLFFNPRQHSARAAIHETIEQTGVPSIAEREGKLWVEVPSGTMQCVFACNPREPARPVGVMLLSRPSVDTLWISHLAVDPDETLVGRGDEPSASIALVSKAVEIARQIKGVIRVRLPYNEDGYLDVAKPVNQADGPRIRDSLGNADGTTTST